MTVVAVTKRLELREFVTSDAAELVRLNSDPEVVRYTGDPPFASVDEARELIEELRDRYARDGYSRWAVVRRDTGDFIGWCGLSFRPASGEIDLGFRLFRAAWGQGFATEAARASLSLGFEVFHLQAIVGRAMEGNAASHHILRKLGFTPVATFAAEGARWTQYELTAVTWSLSS
jgi:RimJ/RimL family protein N-acetyltransferase